MKNGVICKNCSSENPIHTHICSNCKYFFRDRVYNINIWETVEQIIEAPGKAFLKIVYSEHKNFIVFLSFLLGLRILVLSRFVSVPISNLTISTTPLILSYLISLSSIVILFLLSSSIIMYILNKTGYKVRFRDIYTLNIYSNIPNLFAVIILLPIELIVFGDYLFSNNPNPFQVKPTIAYILSSIEFGMLIWAFILNVIALNVLTRDKKLSASIAIGQIIITLLLILTLANTIFFLY
jgi:hypothetical protein